MPHAAEDAAQEVFLRAYTGLGRFRFGSSVYTWLYATLRNALSFSNMPWRLPTLSNVDTLRVPSIAALEPMPTLDLSMPALSRIKSSRRQSTRTTSTPN